MKNTRFLDIIFIGSIIMLVVLIVSPCLFYKREVIFNTSSLIVRESKYILSFKISSKELVQFSEIRFERDDGDWFLDSRFCLFSKRKSKHYIYHGIANEIRKLRLYIDDKGLGEEKSILLIKMFKLAVIEKDFLFEDVCDEFEESKGTLKN